ncbi:unnamed protein product [Bathycoccus prasinos]
MGSQEDISMAEDNKQTISGTTLG